jgi:hypothetical protein
VLIGGMTPILSVTGIEVLDDAVKIGLGGLIGGIFAFLVARQGTKGNIQRLKFERRSKILQEAAQKYEDFFQAFYRYSSLLAGIEGAKPPEDVLARIAFRDLLREQIKKALGLRFQWAEQTNNALAAQAQLMLLGEEQCRKRAEALWKAIVDADAGYQFDGSKFDLSRADETEKVVRDAREAFYKEMQRAFEKG